MQHRGFNEQIFPAILAAAGHLPVFHQVQQPVEVLLIHNAAQVRAGKGICPVQGANGALQRLGQLGSCFAGAQNIIWRHAGLPGVDELAPGNPLGCQVQICRVIHNARGLAAKLQRHRGQVLGCRLHHHFAHRRGAGEEDHIELLRQQGLILCPSPFHHGNVFRVVQVADQLMQQGRGGRRIGRGLQHGTVASRNGRKQGINAEQEGIIPGGHNEGQPIGIPINAALGGEMHQGCRHTLGTLPLGQMLPHGLQLLLHQEDFRFVGFEGTLVQVGIQGMEDVLLVEIHPLLQHVQLPQAEGHVQRLSCGEELPLHRQKLLHGQAAFRVTIQAAECLLQLILRQAACHGTAGMQGLACQQVNIPHTQGGIGGDFRGSTLHHLLQGRFHQFHGLAQRQTVHFTNGLAGHVHIAPVVTTQEQHLGGLLSVQHPCFQHGAAGGQGAGDGGGQGLVRLLLPQGIRGNAVGKAEGFLHFRFTHMDGSDDGQIRLRSGQIHQGRHMLQGVNQQEEEVFLLLFLVRLLLLLNGRSFVFSCFFRSVSPGRGGGFHLRWGFGGRFFRCMGFRGFKRFCCFGCFYFRLIRFRRNFCFRSFSFRDFCFCLRSGVVFRSFRRIFLLCLGGGEQSQQRIPPAKLGYHAGNLRRILLGGQDGTGAHKLTLQGSQIIPPCNLQGKILRHGRLPGGSLRNAMGA